MKVQKERPFISELATQSLKNIDFSDTFSTTNHKNSLKKITYLIFGKSPKWIQILFATRNCLVKIIGIKEQKPLDYHEQYKVDGYIGFFKIYSITENEVLLGLDDSHLNFRASICDTKTKCFNIKVTTLVEYNNKKGKKYMKFIKPFHELVVKSIVKQAVAINS